MLAALLAPVLLAAPAAATEVVWDGHYRVRAEAFDTLSLSRTNPDAEGASAFIDHRLLLRPSFLLSDRVSIHTQLDLLPWVLWGDEPVQPEDPVTGETTPVAFSEALQPPTTEGEGAATLQNLRVTRLWGEVRTPWGLVRAGRIPVHWATGMVLNDGTEPDAEHGDTADRVEVVGRAGDVFLRGGYEVRDEGYVGDPDDTSAVVGSVFYASELVEFGLYTSYLWYRTSDTNRLGLWLGDLGGRADLGPLELQGEFAVLLGSGDLAEGVNDVNVSAFGANLGALVRGEHLRVGIEGGLAGGDADTADSKIHTFRFDPDYNRTLVLFEEPVPVLDPAVKTDANGGRETGAVQAGDGISNALYLNPRVGWAFREGLEAELSLFAAQQAKPSADLDPDRKGYGSEIDLDVRWAPVAHLSLRGTAAVFFPGTYFSAYEHEDFGGGFDAPVYAGRLIGTLSF